MDEDSAVWDDAYSVGHAGIDYQHKDLVRMTNDLFEVCKKQDSQERLHFIVALKEAATYASIHFADEEKYMAAANYPNLSEHKVEHEKFVAHVTDVISKFDTGETKTIDMARFLKNWLLNHIAKSDKKYAPYLAAKA